MWPRCVFVLTERNTECLSKITDDFVRITCSANFAGNWAPTMEWRKQKDQIIEDAQFSFDMESVTSTLFLPLNWTNDVTAFKINVITTFDDSGKPSETSATNVPEYNHTISPYTSG